MTVAAPRFCEVDGRRVAWRTAGAGPVAMLLHGSPQSSRALGDLGEVVAAAGLCAVTPDTPGAGYSAPLPKTLFEIADLADALARFADVVGLGRFALYGSHTGAAIAYAFAARFPARVTTLVLDGIAAWTAAERAAYAQDYAPPFLPVADGTHLTWLWSRMEAQSVFFPWTRQTPETWRRVDLSPPWHLHRNAMEMLDAGDAYRAIYHASLSFDPAQFFPTASLTQILTLESDVLLSHAGRPGLSHLPRRVMPDKQQLFRAVTAAMAAHPGDPAPSWPAPVPFWRGSLAGNGRPVVLLHPAGASSRVFEFLLPALANSGPVAALDLPGHGLNETFMPETVTQIAAQVAAQCEALGFDSYNIAGRRFGGVIAQALARQGVTAADLGPRSSAPDLAALGAVSLTPEWDGAHLLRAWRVAWRQALWDPWYRPDAAAARTPPGAADPASIHASAIDLLRAGPAGQRATRLEAAAGPAATTLPDPADHSLPDAPVASLAAWRQLACGSGPASAATTR